MADTSRKLTIGEVAYAREIFGTSLDLDKVVVH